MPPHTDDPRSKMKTAALLQQSAVRGSFATVSWAAVTFPLGILSTVLVARALGPVPFGRLALLTLLTGTVLPLLDFGFQASFMQWAAAAEAEGDHNRTARLMRQRFGWVLLSQAVPLIAIGPIVLHSQAVWVQLAYVVAAVANLGVGGMSLSLVVQNRTATGAWLSGLSSVMGAVAAISAALATHSSSAVWVSRMLPGIVLIPIYYLLTDRRLRSSVFRPSWPSDLPRGYWRFAFLTWIAIGTGTLVFSRSEAFVMHLYGQDRALGIFALAFGVSSQMTAPLDLVVGPLAPAIAAVAAVDPRRAVAAMLRATRFFALGAGALTAIIPTVSVLIPAIYGGSYREATGLLLPLAAVSTFQSTANALALSTYARRDGKTLAVAHAAALVVDLGLAFALIPALHAWGAVVANGASQVVAIGWLLRRELAAGGLSPLPMLLTARAWACGVGAALGAAAISPILPGSEGAASGVVLFLGLSTYFLLLRLTGGALEDADHRALSGALPGSLGWFLKFARLLIGVRSTEPVRIPLEAEQSNPWE